MIITEALLITCLAAVLMISSYTDLKESIIPNRYLLSCAVIAIICDVIYYAFWMRDCLSLFLINYALLAVVGIVFYAYNLWAAGDCKLLLVVGLCIPGRFYTFSELQVGVSFYIVALVFSLAFLYVVIESIVLGIKDRQLFNLTFGRFDWKEALISYFAMVGALAIIGAVLSLILPVSIERGESLSIALNFLAVLTLIRLRQKVSIKVMAAVMAVSWIGVLFLSVTGIYTMRLVGDPKSWLIVLVIMLLRLISEKYNYRVIPTQEVKAGQILSAATVLGMSSSRVQGLPTGSTEDLRSRLTASEAESVRRWETSAQGKHYVVIVRKIPFAVFISAGTVLFLAFEVAML